MTVHPAASRTRQGFPRVLVRALDLTEQIVGALCLTIILILVSVQVVQRVTTGSSWVWSGEIAKFAMVWMTFVLAAHLLRTDAHLKVDVIEQWLSSRGERILTRITDGLIALSCWGLVWAGWGLLTAPFLGSAPASGLPLLGVYAGPVVGLVLVALTATWFAVVGRSAEDHGDGELPEGVF